MYRLTGDPHIHLNHAAGISPHVVWSAFAQFSDQMVQKWSILLNTYIRKLHLAFRNSGYFNRGKGYHEYPVICKHGLRRLLSLRRRNNNNDHPKTDKCKKLRRLWGRYVCIRLVNPYERGMRTHDLGNGLGIDCARDDDCNYRVLFAEFRLVWEFTWIYSTNNDSLLAFGHGMDTLKIVMFSVLTAPMMGLKGSYPPVLHPNSKIKECATTFRIAVRGCESDSKP